VFNPATPLDHLDYVMDKLDLILIMSVNPGFGGQKFIPGALEKLRQVRRRIDESGRAIRLEVDGGVTADNIGAIAAAGADTFVAGSAIFHAKDYRAEIAAMRKAIAKSRIQQTPRGVIALTGRTHKNPGAGQAARDKRRRRRERKHHGDWRVPMRAHRREGSTPAPAHSTAMEAPISNSDHGPSRLVPRPAEMAANTPLWFGSV
jgi:dihydrodipicolinate synthase/N-acetylneuraminate lyase